MKKLFLFLSVVGGPSWLGATNPTISTASWTGNLLYGTTVTLTTTNTTARPAAFLKPIVYADGEEGSMQPNSVYSTSTTWNDTDTVQWKNSNCYAGAGCQGSTSGWENQAGIGDLTFGIRHKQLTAGTTYHTQWAWKGDIMEVAAKNWKFWRYWPPDWTGSQRYPNHWWALDVASNQPLFYNENDGTVYATSNLDRIFMNPAATRQPFPDSTNWRVVDIYWKSSSAAYATDGGFWIYLDGTLYASDATLRDKYTIAGGAPSDQTQEPVQFYFQAQFSNGSPSLSPPTGKYINWDNMVLDISNTHVEVSTSSTWAAGGHRLYAPVVSGASWGTTTAIFALPQGGYTNGQTLYVYVYNDAREVNASGYAVTYNSDLAPVDAPFTPGLHAYKDYRCKGYHP